MKAESKPRFSVPLFVELAMFYWDNVLVCEVIVVSYLHYRVK